MTAQEGREHLCPARDGTVLRGLVWECARPKGLVVIRTPYDAERHASTARSWNARGYHCLVQDVRGRYRSAGTWSPYTHEEDDGGRALARLAAEYPGLPLVLFGASYAAHTALEAARAAARDGTPQVAAIIVLVPALGLAETAWDAAGAPQIRHRIGWWHEHGRLRRSLPPLPVAELDRRTAQARAQGVVEAAEGWGWAPPALTGWRRLWSAERVDLAARYGHLAAPLLVISGDDDFFHDDARRLARAWGASNHFASGPWGHHLVGGVTDEALRTRVRAAGGLTHVIDPWLAAHGLPGTPAAWTRVLAATAEPRTRSTFDPASGAWRHERSSP
ncbi:CocE/NonD family hydrolase [Marinactinospora thermotolerans]|uniref:Putative hydrolase, CocE/NonD family n=1 Tax=Marinactinospora thermotolerans DSM 45154 TaxID=1122192 RepID=A0A1T4NR54_9ACTN|nr:CocE/NonD family hydrolase [Marinactinospora thermotolerans]SJZ81198.1 putative hydrolase, CocE/NonD family [Marinactinospora thermotolerans DSM 45154]